MNSGELNLWIGAEFTQPSGKPDIFECGRNYKFYSKWKKCLNQAPIQICTVNEAFSSVRNGSFAYIIGQKCTHSEKKQLIETCAWSEDSDQFLYSSLIQVFAVRSISRLRTQPLS